MLLELAALLPFSPFRGLVWKIFDKKSRRVLELGSGKGAIGILLSLRRWNGSLVGTERFFPYINLSKRSRKYEGVIACDLGHLPFRPKSFDAVLCIEVLEHLRKSEGEKLLEEVEELSKRQIIFSLPVGWEPSKEYDGNPLRRHQSEWSIREFLKRGYKVHGQYPAGVDFLYWVSHVVPLYLLVYNFPRFSSHILCHKEL